MKAISISFRAAALLLMMSALVACGGRADPPQPYGSAPLSQAPLVTTNPADQTVAVGQTATFAVVASGTAPLSYQWQKGGVAISAATGASYTTPATVAGDSGTTYQVVVSNAVGSVTSASALLTVTVPTVVSIAISPQPQSISVAAGAQASFSLQATCSDASAPTYQWLRSNDAGANYATIAGATAATYAFTTASGDNNARFYAEATCANVTMGSSVAILTVTTAAPPVTGSNVGPCYGTGPAGGWCSQNRNPVSIDLRAGAAASATTAWATGQFGTVIKTTDGGTTWKRVRGEDAAGGEYLVMSAADLNNVWAGNNTGQIIHTSDGGVTWVVQTSGTTGIFSGMVANSATTAWADTSSDLLRTTNGGATWTKLTTLPAPYYLLAAPNASTAFVPSGSGATVALTTDGGTTWKTSTLADTQGGQLSGISAPTPTVAWICASSGVIQRTTDGVTWTVTTRQPFNQLSAVNQGPLAILAFDAMTAYVSYGDGTIVKTTDGGATWTYPDTSKFYGEYALFAGSTTAVWGVGTEGSIYKSEDQGATFFEQSKGPRYPLYSVSAIDINNAWAAGYGGSVARTTDGGTTWLTVLDDTNGVPVQTTNQYQVSGVSASTAYAAGGNQTTLLKTVDGGMTWPAVTGFGTPEVRSVATVGASTVWIAGSSGFVAKSTDAGSTWSTLSSGTTRNAFNIYALNDQVAYASFDDGSWRGTADGGATWTVASGLSNQVQSIVLLDASHLVAVGLKGLIVTSSDSGATVTASASGTTNDLDAVTRSGTTVWVGGVYTILRSDDSGATWRTQPVPLEIFGVYGMSAVDSKTVWSVSSNAAIFKTTDGGD